MFEIGSVAIMSETEVCIFCDIVAGKVPGTIIEYSNENIVIFKDIKPASDYHYLAVPRNHMQNVRSCSLNDKDLSMSNCLNVNSLYLGKYSFCSQFSKCKMSCGIFSTQKM